MFIRLTFAVTILGAACGATGVVVAQPTIQRDSAILLTPDLKVRGHSGLDFGVPFRAQCRLDEKEKSVKVQVINGIRLREPFVWHVNCVDSRLWRYRREAWDRRSEDPFVVWAFESGKLATIAGEHAIASSTSAQSERVEFRSILHLVQISDPDDNRVYNNSAGEFISVSALHGPRRIIGRLGFVAGEWSSIVGKWRVVSDRKHGVYTNSFEIKSVNGTPLSKKSRLKVSGADIFGACVSAHDNPSDGQEWECEVKELWESEGTPDKAFDVMGGIRWSEVRPFGMYTKFLCRKITVVHNK